MNKIRLKNIVIEGRKCWLYHDPQQQHLTIYIYGVSVSNSDCTFPATIDGLSLSIARMDWHHRQPGLPRLPHAPKQHLIQLARKHNIV